MERDEDFIQKMKDTEFKYLDKIYINRGFYRDHYGIIIRYDGYTGCYDIRLGIEPNEIVSIHRTYLELDIPPIKRK
jgi:hypothetical protein